MSDKNFPSREYLLDLLVSRLSDYVILLLDPEGTVISWHPGVERQFGYSAAEFLGQSGEILFPLPDRFKGAFRRELQTAVEKGRAGDTNWMVTKNGRPVFVEGLSLALRDPASGELLGFGKVLNDITQRKQTEDDRKTLTRMLDQSSIYVFNWDGIIEHWTSGCERIYGWKAQEAVAQNADDLLQTVYSDGASGIRDQLLQEGAWQGELQQIKKDGNPVYVSADWVLFSDGQDKQPSVIATHTDITSRIQVQRELEDANKRLQSMARELERSNAELEEFARIASHDLSTPITSARWLVELLAARHAGSLDAEGQKMLQQITVGLQRMTDLVEAILSHARVGTEPIGAPKPVSADQALDMALANLQKDVNLSGAVVRREPMPQLLIEAQPLAQLFQNLIANAIKYRREGIAPEITIQARAHDGMWLLSVSDNGMGIEPEWFERIFQPMQRLHSAKIAGSGIGLATCRKIVTRAGGQIWVESTVGSGSTFFFTLPGPEAH